MNTGMEQDVLQQNQRVGGGKSQVHDNHNLRFAYTSSVRTGGTFHKGGDQRRIWEQSEHWRTRR